MGKTTEKRPTVEEANNYIELWEKYDNSLKRKLELQSDSMENYRPQEVALEFLFKEKFKNNTNINEVIVKIAVLDNFYSTQIRRQIPFYKVAEKITTMDFDNRIKKAEPTLVAELAMFEVEEKNILSFASKYCSFSQRYSSDVKVNDENDNYPIYDSIVVEQLWKYQKSFNFSNFKKNSLTGQKNEKISKKEIYDNFRKVIKDFKEEFFKGEKMSLREIDQFLWLKGKIEDARKPKKNKKA